MHEFQMDVRPSDLDSFGHVNNARYLEYLEWARAALLQERGYSYTRFWEMQLFPAVVDVKLRYQLEIGYGEHLTIKTRVEYNHPSRVTFFQEIYRRDGRRAMRAKIGVVAVDGQTRTLTEYPADMLTFFENAPGTPQVD